MGKLKNHFISVVAKSWNFSKKLTSSKDDYLNASMGLAGEAGEVLEIHKKIYFHSNRTHESERQHLLLELGDVFYYLLKVMDLWGFTLKDVLEANREKLVDRHPELFK